MTKRLCFSVLLLTLIISIFCAPVTQSQARQVASNLILERANASKNIASVMYLNNETESHIYVINLRPAGFILLSGDDAAYPVLGYDFNSNWTGENIPVQLQEFLQSWQKQLSYIIKNQLRADDKSRDEWVRLSVSIVEFVPQRNERDVAPLLTTTWGQEGYYNDLCPSNTPVGCVATAMSQIMKFWNFPITGSGSHSYNCPPYGTLSADFANTTYNWTDMPNQVSSPNLSVATLCYHAGVAVNMQYNPNGSGAYSTDVPNALRTYFKYASSTTYYDKSSYSDANWASMLRGEFDNRRPVYYSGSGSSGGHAFVLDGYQSTDHFYVNWGWDGYYNGYYYLNNLNPGGENFSSSQAAVMGIAPTQSNPALTEGFEGTTFPPSGWSRSAATWSRSTSSPITGTASAYYNGTANNVRLVTPKLSITTTSTLSFKAKRGSTNRYEIINIQYSTNGTSWTTYYTTAALTATATTYSCTFSTLTAGDYYIAFNANSSNSNSNIKSIWLDDVSGPNLSPLAAINLTSWDAGNVAPGEIGSSGPTFQLSNIGGGTLTISSVTDLSSSEFKSTINPSVQLVYGQVHTFGFTYEPLNYGTDTQTFQIVTNGGTISISLTGQAPSSRFSDGFENYDDFALSFGNWTQYDGDHLTTYTISGCTFPNQAYVGSYIIFNSYQTSPSLGGTPIDAYAGHKGAYCFAGIPSGSVTANDDWLISPAISLTGPTCSVSFYAKAYSSSYPERFKVRLSTTNNTPSSFTVYLAGSATSYITATTTWTQYTYNLNNYSGQTVYIAIECVSADAFIFMVDNFVVNDSGYVPPTPTFGNVNGFVYKYGTTTPIANAKITIGAKSATTNEAGFYQINNLLVGTYSGLCETPGQDYFSSSVSGIVITQGNTTTQNFYLKWSELAVNQTSFTSTLYLGQSQNQTLTISNPGGTANLVYDYYLSPYLGAGTSRNNSIIDKAVPPDPTLRISNVSIMENSRVAVSGQMYYGDVEDAYYYTNYYPERATKFTISDFGLWSNSGVTIDSLEAWFYDYDLNNWGGSNTFNFKIYAANGTTVLYTSPSIVAIPSDGTYIYPTRFTLPTPLSINGDFWIAVKPVGTTTGKPYGLSTNYSYGHSYYGSAGSWTALAQEEHIISAYVRGNYWVYASGGTGTVAPGASENVNINFDTTDLSEGTYRGLLNIVNNSNYIAPSANSRGDNLVIPLTLNVMVAHNGNIQGHVYYAGTTTPVVNAVVSVPLYDAVYTDANGYYSLTGISISTTQISASAYGCQDYTGSVTLVENQTVTRDIYLDYSKFSSSQTVFNLSCETGGTTTASTTLQNIGTFAVDWTADSGIWGGVTYSAGPLNEDFEDYDISGWSGLVGDNSDIYTGYGHTGNATWVFASEGTYTPQYIITPQLKPTASDNLSFWYQEFNNSNEVLQIMISRTDTAIGSFQLVDTINMTTDQVWTHYTLPLGAYSEEDHIYVCFYYPRVDGYQYGYVMIDDITGPEVRLPYSEWLTSTPSGTLAAGASGPFNLYVNAAGLPVGNYTAQTWVFGNATNSPYKLYVNLEVTQPINVEAPQNVLSAAYDNFIELAWDEVANANGYHVYVCDNPYGTYQQIRFTNDTYADIYWPELESLGYDGSKAFFKVTADTQAQAQTNITMVRNRSEQASQPLERMGNHISHKVLNIQ